VQQGDPSRPIRIVLNGIDLGANTILISPEVNQTITPFMPATAVTSSNLTLVITATGFNDWAQEAFFRLGPRSKLDKITDRGPSSPRRGRLVFLYSHFISPLFPAKRTPAIHYADT
jgi:hypothetical protein